MTSLATQLCAPSTPVNRLSGLWVRSMGRRLSTFKAPRSDLCTLRGYVAIFPRLRVLPGFGTVVESKRARTSLLSATTGCFQVIRPSVCGDVARPLQADSRRRCLVGDISPIAICARCALG